MANGNKFENLVSKWMMEEESFLNQVIHDEMQIRHSIWKKIRIENIGVIGTLNGPINDYLVVVLWAIYTGHSPDIHRLIFVQ